MTKAEYHYMLHGADVACANSVSSSSTDYAKACAERDRICNLDWPNVSYVRPETTALRKGSSSC